MTKLFRTANTHLQLLLLTARGKAEFRAAPGGTLRGPPFWAFPNCATSVRFAIHGSGNPRPAMESVRTLLAVAGMIVGFLDGAHRQDRAQLPSSRAFSDDNP